MENLTPTETQAAIAETARRCALQCLDGKAASVAGHLGRAGLIGAMAREDAGGLGLSLRDALPIALQFGRHNLAFPLVESLIATAFLLEHGVGDAAAIIEGSEVGTLAWGGSLTALAENGKWRLKGVASHVTGGDRANWIVARISGDRGVGVAVFAENAPGVSSLPANDLDFERRDADFTLDNVTVAKNQMIWDGGQNWTLINGRGDILRSAAMYGAALACFDAARKYTAERIQFGRPLSAHQSVRHLLARDYLALESLRYSLEYAALTADLQAEDAAIARQVLCGLAAEICPRVAENALQLHGAMGFTREIPLHRHLRRILAASDLHPTRMAREALATSLLQKWGEAS